MLNCSEVATLSTLCLLKVVAMDGDAGSNGELIFSVDDDTNFDIDLSSGEITSLIEFDYENQQSYVVNITVSGSLTCEGVCSSEY